MLQQRPLHNSINSRDPLNDCHSLHQPRREPTVKSPAPCTQRTIRFSTCDPLTAYSAGDDPASTTLSPVNCIRCASFKGPSTFAIERGTSVSAPDSSTACADLSSSVTYTASFAWIRFNCVSVSANPTARGAPGAFSSRSTVAPSLTTTRI